MERAQGTRITWEALPLHVRQAVEDRLGSHVIEAETQQGGFSPGLAARLRAANGKRIFLKASSPDLNPLTPQVHRKEARVAAALPADAPVSRLLWRYDEGEAGWVALAFADVDGQLPALPWKQEELERVVAAIAEMHDALTPCPLDLPSAGERIAGTLSGWSKLRGDETGLDPWSRRHLQTLTALEREAPAAAVGDTMIHMDLRADNILLTDDRVVIVDWPGAAVGAAWIDILGMAPSVVLEGGPDPTEFFATYPAARVADPQSVNAVLSAFAGFFTCNALQPPPPGLPTLRAFQAAQGEIARRWLAVRAGLM
jgi:aminoglycoside phosphotransferase (APT) family kinase protein